MWSDSGYISSLKVDLIGLLMDRMWSVKEVEND